MIRINIALLLVLICLTLNSIESFDFKNVSVNIRKKESLQPGKIYENTKEKLQPRMAGGTNIYTSEQSRYVAGLLIEDEQWCGGVIVTNNRVITAAHCLYEKNNVTAYFGYTNRSSPAPESVLMVIYHKSFTIHFGYDSATLANDIAVITLPEDLQFSYKIQSIPIITVNDTMKYKLASGTAELDGWGVISDSSTTTVDYLQYVIVNLISYQTCQESYPDVTENNLCTVSDTSDPKGGCLGDSGGPLVKYINGIIKLIGIMSFTSTSACQTMEPRGYTKIVSYIDWLCDDCQICSHS